MNKPVLAVLDAQLRFSVTPVEILLRDLPLSEKVALISMDHAVVRTSPCTLCLIISQEFCLGFA